MRWESICLMGKFFLLGDKSWYSECSWTIRLCILHCWLYEWIIKRYERTAWCSSKRGSKRKFWSEETGQTYRKCFSNCVEVSAQEAVYLALQIPLTKCTRDIVFMNKSTPEERIFLLKLKSVLGELPAESTDVESDNMIQRYSKRNFRTFS